SPANSSSDRQNACDPAALLIRSFSSAFITALRGPTPARSHSAARLRRASLRRATPTRLPRWGPRRLARAAGASPMTRRAARAALNLVLRAQPSSELALIRRRDVVHAEHRGPRPHVALRIAMAVDAPLHLQRFLLPHQGHPVDLSVAGRASNAL